MSAAMIFPFIRTFSTCPPVKSFATGPPPCSIGISSQPTTQDRVRFAHQKGSYPVPNLHLFAVFSEHSQDHLRECGSSEKQVSRKDLKCKRNNIRWENLQMRKQKWCCKRKKRRSGQEEISTAARFQEGSGSLLGCLQANIFCWKNPVMLPEHTILQNMQYTLSSWGVAQRNVGLMDFPWWYSDRSPPANEGDILVKSFAKREGTVMRRLCVPTKCGPCSPQPKKVYTQQRRHDQK